MASLRLNRVVGTSDFLLWGQGKTQAVLAPGKGKVDVGQSWQEGGQEHPGEPGRLLCRKPATSRVRTMLLETAKVADPMALATQRLDSQTGELESRASTAASWMHIQPHQANRGGDF